MTAPRVSVIVPAYNAAATLPACLAALEGQDYPAADYEIIVADDGSTDGNATAKVAEAAPASTGGPLARVLRLPHRGPAAARNAGAAAAQGDLLLFTDADCEPLPDWISQMVAPFADEAVVGVKGSYLTRQREVVARLVQCEFEERYDRLAALPEIDFVDSYSAAWRASAFSAAGGFDESFPYASAEDAELSYRIAAASAAGASRLLFNRDARVYHQHVHRWSDYIRVKSRRSYWRTLVYRRHPGKALRDSYTPQLLKLQVLLVYATAGAAAAAAALAMVPSARRALRLHPSALILAPASLVLSTLPFVRAVRRCDRPVAPYAPLLILARAIAFAAAIPSALAHLILSNRP